MVPKPIRTHLCAPVGRRLAQKQRGRTVRCLDVSFTWAACNFEYECRRAAGVDICQLYYYNLARTTSATNAFSAVCGDMIADLMMCCELGRRLGKHVSGPWPLASVDRSEEWRREQLIPPKHPEYIKTPNSPSGE